MRKEFILTTWGGIGDVMIITPAIKALKENYPDHKIIVYCTKANAKYGHKAVLQNNPHVDSLRVMHWTTLWRYPYHCYLYLFRRKKFRQTSFQYVPPTYLGDRNVKEIAADMFNITLRDEKVQLFFTRPEEEAAKLRLSPYRNVIFMHITSSSSINHHWQLEKWIELVKLLPEYTFIQLGRDNELYVQGAVDWRGKTGLREALCLIKHATSFVGIESSLAHATNAFDLPGVVLFGDTSPTLWGHHNNFNIYKNASCSPCYYLLWGGPCYYGNRCMKEINVEEVREALVQQVNKRLAKTTAPAVMTLSESKIL